MLSGESVPGTAFNGLSKKYPKAHGEQGLLHSWLSCSCEHRIEGLGCIANQRFSGYANSIIAAAKMARRSLLGSKRLAGVF